MSTRFLGRRLDQQTERRIPVVVCLIAIALVMTPRAALAHAVLVKSTPQANGTVTGPEIVVQLQYNSRVDSTRSQLTLLKPDGKVERLAIANQTAPNQLSAKVTGLSKGSYVLRWQALSSDGHITRGQVPFHIQ